MTLAHSASATESRSDEVRHLLRLTKDELHAAAGERLVVLSDLDALHQHFAESIFDEIQANLQQGRPTRLILPVGPVGQYPILADLVNSAGLGLQQCFFFMMDEHCDANGLELSADHPLSFRGAFHEQFASRVSPKLLAPAEVIFPDHCNLHTLAARIAAVGGIDTAYGGIGIHGHVAYNEPEAGVRETNPRLVELNEITRTINAIRSEIGGNLENYPRHGLTLGMRQVLGARRIRLYCRNGLSLDWANTILRLALLGRPGDDYPVTHLRGHADYVIVTDEQTGARAAIRHLSKPGDELIRRRSTSRGERKNNRRRRKPGGSSGRRR